MPEESPVVFRLYGRTASVSNQSEKQLNSSEAADIVSAIADSLRTNPGQFQLVVNISGFVAQNSGGSGFVAQNNGGIGFNASIGNAQIQTSQQQADTALSDAVARLQQKLQEMEKQLRTPAHDKGELKSIANSIYAEKWVPGVIAAIVAAVIKAMTS